MSVYFPPRPLERGPLCIAKQNKRPLAVLRCVTAARLAARCSPRPRLRPRASPSRPQGAAITSRRTTMTTIHDTTADLHEPGHAVSSTARVIEELELLRLPPIRGEPDPRPLPDTGLIAGAISDLFDILAGAYAIRDLSPTSTIFSGTSPISSTKSPPAFSASSTTMKTGRSAARRNRTARKSAPSNSNASSPRDKPPRAARDLRAHPRFAAERFEAETGSAWRPRAGSLVNHKT